MKNIIPNNFQNNDQQVNQPINKQITPNYQKVNLPIANHNIPYNYQNNIRQNHFTKSPIYNKEEEKNNNIHNYSMGKNNSKKIFNIDISKEHAKPQNNQQNVNYIKHIQILEVPEQETKKNFQPQFNANINQNNQIKYCYSFDNINNLNSKKIFKNYNNNDIPNKINNMNQNREIKNINKIYNRRYSGKNKNPNIYGFNNQNLNPFPGTPIQNNANNIGFYNNQPIYMMEMPYQ